MKLERAHEYLLPITVVGGGVFLALYLGTLSGRGQMGTLGAVLFLIVATAALLVLREQTWMLIPIFYSLSGKVTMLPLPFSIRHIAILFAVGSFLLFKAFKVIRRKPTFTTLDVWLLIILAYLATVFLRNPVGVEALGSERVGGRPYVEVALSCGAYWVLSCVATTPRQATLLPFLSTLGSSIEFTLSWVANRFPSTTPILTQLYSGVSTTAYDNLDAQNALIDPSTRREAHFGGVGQTLALAAVSYFRPFTLINPLFFFRFVLFLFALYAIFISGFRSLVAAAIVYFCLSEYFRRGLAGLFQIGLLAAPALALLLTMQGVVFDLPFSVQRSLSFLPARWNPTAKGAAEASTEWRVEMWKQMLLTDRYIENKWLGDGFGFTRQQLQRMIALSNAGDAEGQESFMLQGGVHSGPISAIRYVGYVGLILFVGLLCVIARDAWHLVWRSRNTPYFFLALFVGLPAIWEPVNYIFIFGAYEGGLPRMIVAAGMLKMLANSLESLPDKNETPQIAEPRRIASIRRPDMTPTFPRTVR